MSRPASVLRQRDCFRFAEKEKHLWVVLSDPEQDPAKVLVVNATTLKEYKDKTCTLSGGCHEHITHESCINYAKARVYTAVQLNSLLSRDIIYLCDRYDEPTFYRIWEGAILSPHTKRPHSSILLAQGYSDPANDIDF